MTNTAVTQTPPIEWPDYGIGFVDAIKRGFKKYATFSGRASRREFWWWVLGTAVIGAVLGILLGLGMHTDTYSGTVSLNAFGVIMSILLVVFGLGIIVPTIAVTVRRLHDAGFSGWFYLLTLIGGIGGIIVYIMCALQTSPNAPKYGPPVPAGYVPPTHGHQGQVPQGQVAPQGQVPPQGQFAPQGQAAPQGQVPPVAPQGQVPPQGQTGSLGGLLHEAEQKIEGQVPPTQQPPQA
ncbi:MAG: DUF805 domain-containing protein [Gordonia sp. (in: high G+C Gram-positive bacteria)]|uniref:DUF805 domain-containing protein n=1 Tax=Gordonia sp. (in: high G+C Gram-positive bacteria) TaxID=84139 RepID=UPI0039E5CDA2